MEFIDWKTYSELRKKCVKNHYCHFFLKIRWPDLKIEYPMDSTCEVLIGKSDMGLQILVAFCRSRTSETTPLSTGDPVDTSNFAKKQTFCIKLCNSNIDLRLRNPIRNYWGKSNTYVM